MESVIISGNSKKDIRLLVNIAQKMGLTVKFVKEDDLEDFGIGKAVTEGKTGECIDTDVFLKSLKFLKSLFPLCILRALRGKKLSLFKHFLFTPFFFYLS